MPVFNYLAINRDGVKIKGSVEAESVFLARNTLYQRKLFLLKIKMKQRSIFSRWFKIYRFVSNKNLVLITRQMSILVSSSIPLNEALELIEKQNGNRNINNVIYEVRKRVQEGHSLSDSLSQFPFFFSSLYRTMVAVGEVSGHLDLALSNLAEHIEQVYKIKSKIIQSLIYPIVLIIISICIVIILLVIVIPNIIEQFILYDKSLPLSTRILILTSNWLEEYFFLMITIFVISFTILLRVSKIKKINIFLGFYCLKLPIFGKLIFNLNISRYLRMMFILASNGIDLIKAMEISCSVVTNLYVKSKLEVATRLVSEGGSVSSSLANGNIFPPMVLHMISSGERSGRLEFILDKIAESQEQELLHQINILMILLEPIIMLFMAVFIFLIVLSIFQPMLEMNNLVL